MKVCPNDACPFLQEMHTAAEYADDIDRCADCGAQLVAAAEPETSNQQGQRRHTWNFRRILFALSLIGITSLLVAVGARSLLFAMEPPPEMPVDSLPPLLYPAIYIFLAAAVVSAMAVVGIVAVLTVMFFAARQARTKSPKQSA